MSRLVTKFWRDEAGVVISAELVLILTIVVLGVVVGLVQVRSAVVAELNDLGLALSHLNQSYAYSGFSGAWKPGCGWTSWTSGSSFIDLYEGSDLMSHADIGIAGGGAAFYGGGAMIGGSSFGTGVGRFASGRLGTIVLADGTLVPISLVALGTWSLPGGALLVEYTSQPGLLVLANGVRISYRLGGPGIVRLPDGSVFAARPGPIGTLVLSDGRIATFSTTDSHAVLLADGTTGQFLAANLNHVILSDGTSVAVVSGGEAGTLTLSDGRVLLLSSAVSLPSGRLSAQVGTIVLADGTLIPLARDGAGRWTVAGGAVLVESATETGRLVLADGSSIPFLSGAPGVVQLADGVALAARPGVMGTLVLSDGRIAAISTTDAQIVTLADGTTGQFVAAKLDHVILADGTSVAVKTGEAGTLVLPDGRVLRLSDAVLPEGAPQPHPIPDQPDAPHGTVLPGDRILPAAPCPVPSFATPPCPQLPDCPTPGGLAPEGMVLPQFAPPPAGRGLPTFRRGPARRNLHLEIPAGPIPQNLPQV